ncbi:hypothetical protein AB0M43_30855 [Longispora sp. NPDC051575]|uniref:TetR/AcrR family transcriptional regulator n=1 Tax=Longispora sp. NPDC051575 TaxID=3154943 RepID=UPI0034472377
MNGIDVSELASRPDIRDALCEVIRDLVESEGVAALTVAAVAERGGVSVRAVRLNFAGRAELVDALFEHVNEVEDLEGSILPVLDAPDGASALDEWAAHLGRFVPRVLEVARQVERVADSDPDARPHWEAAVRMRHNTCRVVVGRLESEGLLAAPWTVDTATDMMLALISNDVFEVLLGTGGWTGRQIAAHLRALFRATFLAG